MQLEIACCVCGVAYAPSRVVVGALADNEPCQLAKPTPERLDAAPTQWCDRKRRPGEGTGDAACEGAGATPHTVRIMSHTSNCIVSAERPSRAYATKRRFGSISTVSGEVSPSASRSEAT